MSAADYDDINDKKQEQARQHSQVTVNVQWAAGSDDEDEEETGTAKEKTDDTSTTAMDGGDDSSDENLVDIFVDSSKGKPIG